MKKFQFLKHFVGADVMTLKVNNLYQTNLINIIKDYAVTEKADGERMFMFIPQDVNFGNKSKYSRKSY